MSTNKKVKIVVFVPKSHADIIRKAMGDAGAGQIRKYTHCSYTVEGVGRYLPGAGAKPFIGEMGKLESVEEERVECICDQIKAKRVITAMRKAYPYEEVAFDIYPLVNEEDL